VIHRNRRQLQLRTQFPNSGIHTTAVFLDISIVLFCLKYGTFRGLDSVSVFRRNLLSWDQSTELSSYLQTPALESGSELLYDWRFTASQFVLAPSPLRPNTRIFIFQLNTWDYSPYVISSLTRGWVCRLQLLLVLASAVILRSKSRGTHDHILPSQIRNFPNLEGQVPVFIYPRNKVVRIYPQAVGSLSVASYDSQGYSGGIRPASTWKELSNSLTKS
jgi:hypothetical protein